MILCLNETCEVLESQSLESQARCMASYHSKSKTAGHNDEITRKEKKSYQIVGGPG